MFSVAPKVLFYSWNVFTLAPVLKSNPSEPLSHGYWIPPYGFRSCPGTRFLINPGTTYKQIRTPIVEQGGRRRGGGGRVDGTPPRSFWYVTIFRNDFDLSGKTLIFLTKWGIFYGWWRCGKACDVTNNGRHLGCHPGFYQELEIRLKPLEMVIFCASHEK